ncbi:DsbC family protein [Polaromonas aquatica]|uniref:DsbC family protein n=1 Tax=Polaromonas aquatica TaxID=332657 RepID=UPI003D646C87
MHIWKTLALLSFAMFTLAPAFAQEAVIRKNLSEKMPPSTKIDEVSKTPISGLYEVRVGFDIFYTDEQGRYLLRGSLLDTQARRNLTEERIEKLSAVDFDKLPLGDAFKIVRGDGARKLAIFEDPNCGYCKRFELELANVNNVTVYVFLYPVLGQDSTTKSRNIWCAADKAKTWSDWMTRSTTPPQADCDTNALQRNREFGQKYNITGTPTVIFADGSRAPGAISAQEVEKRLASAKAPP